jgi:hypothetical protein
LALSWDSALPIARAQPAPPVAPAISQDVATAVSQMGETLSAKDLSFTAKIIRVYLDPSGTTWGRVTGNLTQTLPHTVLSDVMRQGGEPEFWLAPRALCYSFESRFYGRCSIPLHGGHVAFEQLNTRWPPPHVVGSPNRPLLPFGLGGLYKLSLEPEGSPLFT